MSLLIKLMRKRIGLVLLPVFAGIAAILAALWWNIQIGGIIDTINSDKSILTGMVLRAAAAVLLSAASSYLLGICSGWTCETLAHDLRMGYASYYTKLPLAEIENLNAGVQLSRLQNEINDVASFMRDNLYSFIDDLIRFSGTFSFLLILDPKLMLVTNAPMAIFIWYAAFSSKLIGEAAQLSQQANVQMNGFTDTIVTIFPAVKLYEAVSFIREKYYTALERWENATVKEERRRAALMSLSAIMSCVPMLLLFLIGGSQVIHGTITLGTLYIFINLSENVSGVMMNIPGRIAALRRFSTNMKRLEPFLTGK